MYKDGRRKNFYDGKGAMEIRPDVKACKKILAQTKLAHFNIVNFSRYLLPFAKQLGVTISADLQDVVSADDEYRKEYVRYADVLFFSAANFSDPTPLMMKFLESHSERIIIVGMGERGCGLATRNGVRFFSALDLFGPVIDTNGAGDALAVGFLSSYFMDGFSLEDSVLRGQIAARCRCAVKASSSVLITRKKLDDAFRELKRK
jgi:sugar/nucleoside kinase (ribokinase family)